MSYPVDSSSLTSQFWPLATTFSLPVKTLSATFQSPLLWPPAAGREGIWKALTSLHWYRVCSNSPSIRKLVRM